MVGEWGRSTVGEVTLRVTKGTTPTTIGGRFTTAGVNFVKVESISEDGRIIPDKLAFIDDSSQHLLARSVLREHDVLFTIAGSIGRVAMVETDLLPANTNQAVAIVRPNREVVEPRYLYFVLRDRERVRHANSRVVQSVQANFSLAELSALEIPLPRMAEQRAIAHVLGTLDDKIDLNRRMSETLESMAHELFRSWFVDFDPVRAKMEGRDPGLPREIADLFPDRLVESELGEIPEGWEVRLAGDLFDVAIGKTPPRKEPQWFSVDPQDVPWMSIRDLGQSSVFISRTAEFLTPEAVERFRVRRIPDGTVVLSFKLTVGRVAITDGEMLSNEAIAHFPSSGQTFLAAGYLYCYLSQFRYEALGSTSSIATAVNSDSVRAIPVLVPSQELHDSFVRFSRDAFLRLRELDRENRSIIKLRDTLLPRLLSGELRVPDAERLLAAAPA